MCYCGSQARFIILKAIGYIHSPGHIEIRITILVHSETTGRKRIPFNDEQRRRLAVKGKALTPDERAGCRQIVRPSTILAWFRQLAARKYDSSTQRKKPGRPRKPDEIRELVIRLARENVNWGYAKIRDALRGLKIEVGRSIPVRP